MVSNSLTSPALWGLRVQAAGKYDEITRAYLRWDKTRLLPSNLTGCFSHGQQDDVAGV